MSKIARWAYKLKYTIWPAVPSDDFGGGASFGAPVVFNGIHKAEEKEILSASGDIVRISLSVFSEYALAKVGDMVAVGEFSSGDPFSCGARRVADSIEKANPFGQEPDYEIMTQ